MRLPGTLTLALALGVACNPVLIGPSFPYHHYQVLAQKPAAAADAYMYSPQLSVQTTSGRVRGLVNGTVPHVRQFLGVPYAQKPVGPLRFMAPRRVEAPADFEIDATRYRASCLPLHTNATNIFTEVMTQFRIEGDYGEDCLYVNVYAPLGSKARTTSKNNKLLPVLIWIPGGGFVAGGANSLYTIPDKWVDRTQAHVVLTVNYRLNVFGFPSAAAQPLNVGLLDQRMVVEWARDNVAAFGGDPKRMVLFGQSAGGASVHYYGYAYPSDPIVRGLIAESGTVVDILDGPDPADFSALAAVVGCCGNGGQRLGAADELACMQRVDAVKLADAYSHSPGLSFRPRADGITMFGNMTRRLEEGKVAQIPMIAGQCNNEGSFRNPFNASTGPPPDVVAAFNRAITCGTAAEVNARFSHGLTTYWYQYEGNFSNISPLPWIGATHTAELPLIFGTHYEYRSNSTEFEWAVAEAMQDLWLSLAVDPTRDPTSTSAGFSWDKYDPATKSTVILARDDVPAQMERGAALTAIC